jgi:hypothetical protein
MTLARTLGGAAAGAAAAAVCTLQQPLDKRVFESDYDDVELLGKLVTRGPEWPVVGVALHLQVGAAFGAAYSSLRPFLPGHPRATALAAALAEGLGTWPVVRIGYRYHPARRQLPSIADNRRALLQVLWRHALFGVVLGTLEALINDRSADEPPAVPVSSNGHGNIEAAVTVA